jgi:hypothetical protein
MQVRIDGKMMECQEIRVYAPVTSVEGLTEESQLNLLLTYEGLILDLEELTEGCNGSNSEVTRTFSSTFDELVDLMR